MLFHSTETQAGTLFSALGREDRFKTGHVVADHVRPAAALGAGWEGSRLSSFLTDCVMTAVNTSLSSCHLQ